MYSVSPNFSCVYSIELCNSFASSLLIGFLYLLVLTLSLIHILELLSSGKINNRLLCELATHPNFRRLMVDMEICIDQSLMPFAKCIAAGDVLFCVPKENQKSTRYFRGAGGTN